MDGLNQVRNPITILIAIAVRLYRDGLAATLNAQHHLTIEGTAGTSIEAQAAVRRLEPEVVIVDVSLDDALNLIRALRADSSQRRIIAFAVREEISAILDYAEAGADGFVTANSSMAELVEAIDRTAAGELLCSPRIAAQLLRRAAQQRNDTAGAPPPVFTNREQQVFSLLKQGQSNKEIGNALNIAEATVKNHVHHVLEKLQVPTRTHAATAFMVPLKAVLKPRTSSRHRGASDSTLNHSI
jgi:two-component system nitrate/nitrite response regulator NarL